MRAGTIKAQDSAKGFSKPPGEGLSAARPALSAAFETTFVTLAVPLLFAPMAAATLVDPAPLGVDTIRQQINRFARQIPQSLEHMQHSGASQASLNKTHNQRRKLTVKTAPVNAASAQDLLRLALPVAVVAKWAAEQAHTRGTANHGQHGPGC